MAFIAAGEDGDRFANVARARSPEDVAKPTRILVVDDDDVGRDALAALLRSDGFVTAAAHDGEAAFAEARRTPPDLVLTDLHLPGIDGLELCKRLHELDPDLPVIVMTAQSDLQSVIESLRVAAEDYLVKPLEYEAVRWCVQRAIARATAKREQARLRLQNHELFRTLNERLVLSSIREQEHADAEAAHRVQLNTLLENLRDGVVIADRSGRIQMINEVAHTILRVAEADLDTVDAFGSLDLRGLDGQPLDDEERPLTRALRGEQFLDYEVILTRANGDSCRLVSTGTSVKDENGEVSLAIIVFRDVTTLRRLEQQRDEYTALISHDLRSPLNTIGMCVSALKMFVGIENVSFAERAERSVQRMTAMLQELTEASSLEASGVQLRRAPCDLRELVAGVVNGLADTQARRITVESKEGAAYIVLGDAPRLERIVTNLLTNALKYSAEDAPVHARLSRDASDVELDIVDHGIGIAPENVKLLFDRYYRTPTGKARASGLGLGLYIARLLVEAHGGRIEVSSEVGAGSTFKLMLPSHEASA